MLSNQSLAKVFLGGLFVLSAILTARGASSDVDLSFNANPSKPMIYSGSTPDGSMIVQPDGKLIVFGGFRLVNNVTVNRLVRLNADGSLDGGFNCSECNKMNISSAVLQADGKIIVAGSAPVGNFNKSRTIRLNPDGSVDGSFVVQFSETLEATNYGTIVHAVQPDGKIFVGQVQQFAGQIGQTVYRLNADGSIDASFTTFFVNMRLGRGFVSGIAPLADGRLYVYGATGFGPITRLNANGSEDATFEKPTFTTDVFNSAPFVSDIVVQADGKIVIAGSFNTINGLSRVNFTRLNANGSVDLTFATTTDFLSSPLSQFADGKLLVMKRFDISGIYKPVRLNADGTPDTPLNLPANLVTVFKFETTPTNQIYIFGAFLENGKQVVKYARLNQDGSLDASFNVSIANRGIVNGLALQPDGKVVMVGDFESVNGTLRPTIARVDASGAIDNTFSAGSGFDVPPRDVESDASGRLYVFGNFTSYNGTPRSFFVRLLPSGAIDAAFNVTVNNTVKTVAFQPDGKIFLGGSFTTVNGSAANGIARLNADGSLDATFAPVFGSVGSIESIAVEAGGKVMVGGSFLGVGGFNRQNLVRLNSDGSLDNTFNAGSIEGIRQVTPASGGKYLVATISAVRKLNADGTADPNYFVTGFGNTSVSTTTLRFVVLPNEGVVVVGDYNTVGSSNAPLRGVVALFPNGRIAAQTYPKGANGYTYDIVRQADGKIIVGGDFDLIEEVPRAGVARLNAPNLTKKTFFDYDGDGKADVSVFRASENKWYILRSSDFGVVQQVFGAAGDKPVPADYDGDGKTDIAVWRPSTGGWWYLSSVSGAQVNYVWGQSGDVPLPSDINADGKTDFVVYRPSNGIWYQSTGTTFANKPFGAAGDLPLVGDIEGDGKGDPLVFRPSTGDWWWQSSVDNVQRAAHWGAAGDVPVPADYDNDGKTDLAVFRPSNGGWYVVNSANGSITILGFGLTGDRPAAADYDGDGRADIAVFRPSNGTWYLMQSTLGFGALQWGIATDLPTEASFLP